MNLRVERVSERLHELNPLPLVLTEVVAQACGDRPAITLGLPFGLRLISGGRMSLNTEYMANLFPKIGYNSVDK